MVKLVLIVLCALLMSSGCATEATRQAPTLMPFPTVTPGYEISGLIATPRRLAINPATLAAQSAPQATSTPDTGTCPPSAEAILPASEPENEGEIVNTIVTYLSDGGTPTALVRDLRQQWNILDSGGFVRSDIDLTGEGTPEVIISYVISDSVGALIVLGCANGQYVVRYQDISETPEAPQLVEAADLNRDGIEELFFAYPQCGDDESDNCEYDTQLITWNTDLGRFVSLLGQMIIADSVPEVIDMDNDGIYELVVRLDNRGNVTTGPLRTGVNIYDWDGAVYVLSIVQLDPPLYRVQIIHEADRLYLNGEFEQAVPLYQRALIDNGLRVWRNNESDMLRSYVLYRLLTVYAFIGSQEASQIFDTISQQFPDQNWIYGELSRVFWERLGTTEDISSACDAVARFAVENPAAINTMNSYGNRNPTYTMEDMCPL